MPGPLIKQPDIPAIASRLPQPLQRAGGAAMEGLRQLFGDIPTPATTTIGPGAVPLWDSEGYLNKVLKSTLGEITPAQAGPEAAKKSWMWSHISDEDFTNPMHLEKLINLFSKAATTGPFDK